MEVIYFSKNGSTAKVAKAIGEGAGAEVKSINEFKDFSKDIDILFLGSDVSFKNLPKEFKDFTNSLDPQHISNISVFSSNVSDKDNTIPIKELMETEGFNVIDERFHCLGKFLNLKDGHPDANELKTAKEFGEKVRYLYIKK